MRSVVRALRTMKRGEQYDIEEKIGNGDWEPICECHSINEAKDMLKTLKTLDEDEGNDE